MSQERSKGSVTAASLFLATLAYAGGLRAMIYAQERLARVVELRLVLILSELALALPALIAAVLLARHLPEIHRFEPLRLAVALKTVVLGLALWGFSLGVFEAQYVLVRPPLAYLEQFQGLHDLLKPVGVLGWVFSIAAIAVAPAVCEETLFRGLLTPVFSNASKAVIEPIARTGGSAGGMGLAWTFVVRWVLAERVGRRVDLLLAWLRSMKPASRLLLADAIAIGASAFLFALIHIDAIQEGSSVKLVYYRVPFAFILGMLLAKIRLDTGSLWPPVIAHATLNATTFAVVLLIDEPKGVMPDPRPVVALAMLLFGGVVAGALMRQIRAVKAQA